MQYELVEDGGDWEKYDVVKNAFLNLAYINACARTVNPDLAALISAKTILTGAQDLIEGAINVGGLKDTDHWESFGSTELVARPFADLGNMRSIHFSALGTDWTLVTANDTESVRLAERFAAAAQVMLAALAREDLCLVQTQINIRIVNAERIWTSNENPIESLPSNDGREWVVRLAPVRNPDDANPQEVDSELVAMLATILREASLLPGVDFSGKLERAFERGLGHKLSPGRPFDELAAAFAEEIQPEIQRNQFTTPWDPHNGSFGAHDEISWNDGPGPTYSRPKAYKLLETRYLNLAKGLRVTREVLASSDEFRPTVEALRARGWLDWHILTSILNIALNYRFPKKPPRPTFRGGQK